MSDPFIGEIRIFANTFVPDGWLACDGRTYSVYDYQALAVLIGNNFGSNFAQHTFNVPNLNGNAVVGPGVPTGSATNFAFAHTYGEASVTLTPATMAPHGHILQKKNTNAPVATAKTAAPSAASDLGGLSDATGVTSYKSGVTTATSINTFLNPSTLGTAGQGAPTPHDNSQPYLGLYFGIAYAGIWPSQP